MALIHVSAAAGCILFAFCFRHIYPAPQEGGVSRGRSVPACRAAVLFAAAALLRLWAAGHFTGFGSDTACFAGWADRIFQVGPGAFYSPDVFTDYPPGYLYLLYPVGALRSLLGIESFSPAHLILLKLPSILCDLGCGALLFREAGKKLSPSRAFFLCAAYLFNPAVILNSSLWGQVDSVLTLLLACMCVFLVRGRLVPAYAAFFGALLLKPQALFLAPVLFAAMLDLLIFENFPRKSFSDALLDLLRSLSYFALFLCCAALLCAPFGLGNVWRLYADTVSSYPYAAVNACNFWGLAGLNWISQDNTFMGLPYSFYGYAALIAAVAAVLILSRKRVGDRGKYPLLAALLTVMIFLFSVRMHERYLYPAMLLLLLSQIYNPSRRLFFSYGAFSLLHFYNTADVLFFYDPQNYDRRSPLIILVSLGMLAAACFLCATVHGLYTGRDQTAPVFFTRPSSPAPGPSAASRPLRAADRICLVAITVLYAFFALWDLGDRKAPSTACEISAHQTLTFDFGGKVPTQLSYYIAPWHDRSFSLEGRMHADAPWTGLGEILLENVFTWQDISISSRTPFLQLTLQDSQASLLEFVFTDDAGTVITPVNASDYPGLFDEQDLYPARATFRNGMYFDEIYHARTAYEYLHGLTSYENTHPPLGKILIAAGVSVFGMNPFGWRITGVLFGIAMVPFVFLFARRLTQSTAAAALAGVLFAFDFMHLTQTRIATIDVYITFFVILMYYFMYRYSELSFYDTPLRKTFLPLGASGICMGLGIACKWTGVYAGAGLAVIFFASLYRRYREYRYAASDPEGESAGIPHRRILERFLPCTRNTILFCLCFFVAIPALIYCLSYLPFRDGSDDGLLLRMLHNQTVMFQYHSTLKATHPYSSPWYQWPIIARPIWYFSGQPGGTLREGISAFGNPLVWWAGIPAFACTLLRWLRNRDRKAAFLTVGYLAQYLPWMFVTRVTFIYHYFPSVAFVALMIVYNLSCLRRERALQQETPPETSPETSPVRAVSGPRSDRRFLLWMALYGAAVFGLFLLFHPVLTGRPVEADFVSRWLRWFDSWVLTAR